MPPLLIHTARYAAFWRRLQATRHGKNTKLLWLRVCRHIEQAWLKLTDQKKFVADKRINHFLIWNNLVPSTYEKTHQYYKNRFSCKIFCLRIIYLCFQCVLLVDLWQAGHVWLGRIYLLSLDMWVGLGFFFICQCFLGFLQFSNPYIGICSFAVKLRHLQANLCNASGCLPVRTGSCVYY